MVIEDSPYSSRASNKDELMQIRVYIDPNGDVTITSLMGNLVPMAYALDQADQQMHHWLDVLSETDESRLSEFGQTRQSEPHSDCPETLVPK
jgi:hypothetical protein